MELKDYKPQNDVERTVYEWIQDKTSGKEPAMTELLFDIANPCVWSTLATSLATVEFYNKHEIYIMAQLFILCGNQDVSIDELLGDEWSLATKEEKAILASKFMLDLTALRMFRSLGLVGNNVKMRNCK